MNKLKFALKNLAVLALIISSFIACDKDFASVGADVIGENNFNTNSTKEYPVIAYTNPLQPVQTNNLPLNYLGAFNDVTYGLTTASFVSQLSANLYDPDFGENATIDSVVLSVPYFSRRTEISSEGESTFELDSIFGSDPITLELFENRFFLNSIDPYSEFDTPLRYFSNTSTSNGAISSDLLASDLYRIPLAADQPPLTSFVPSSQEIELWDEDDEVTDRLAPALRVKLDPNYWKEKILEKEGQTELSNANNFNNYFRGIYFKATALNNKGTMALLNFGSSSANITIYYSKDSATDSDERIQTTYILTFSGNRVNFFENQFNVSIPNGNTSEGDELLYLKGPAGSNAVVDILKSGDYEYGFSPEFMAFKNDFVETDDEGKYVKSKRLINEANLVFYVKQENVLGQEPQRVYLYDLNNGTPLSDYYFDITNNTAPAYSKAQHLGILQREGNVSDGQGIKYKIRITEHINNLLLRDSTNVKLGLAVSGNVNLENSLSQYKVQSSNDDIVKTIPVSAILSPRGTVLYGNNTTDETKKLQLEIFYTCIKTDDDCE